MRSTDNVLKLTFTFGVKWGYLNENPMGVYGDLGMDAKRRIQQRLVEFVKQQAAPQVDPEEAARREAAWKQAPAALQ